MTFRFFFLSVWSGRDFSKWDFCFTYPLHCSPIKELKSEPSCFGFFFSPLLIVFQGPVLPPFAPQNPSRQFDSSRFFLGTLQSVSVPFPNQLPVPFVFFFFPGEDCHWSFICFGIGLFTTLLSLLPRARRLGREVTSSFPLPPFFNKYFHKSCPPFLPLPCPVPFFCPSIGGHRS